MIACPDGQYGYNCQEKCNVNCGVPYKCDRITGLCKEGCQVGWKGITCNESKIVHNNLTYNQTYNCLTINDL